jgi:hypothetical protein
VLAGGCAALTVPEGLTLTLNAGAVTKGEQCTRLEVDGDLEASGTGGSPVTLTSVNDASVGWYDAPVRRGHGA